MSSPLQQPVTIARGEDVTLQFQVTPQPGDSNPRTYGFQVKQGAQAEATDSAVVDVSGSYDTGTGIVTVSLTSAQTTAIAKGSYFYWLWRTDSGSQKESAAGPFTVVAAGRY